MVLLGCPVKHSKSPRMHNTAFAHMGLDYVYMAFDVQDGQLGEAVKALKVLGVKGGNITMPHKTEMMRHLDYVSEDAKIIGSVNTFKIDENGQVSGYNTDGRGFVKSLEEADVAYQNQKIVLVGAGGAAKAVATQLAYDGAREIVIYNRTAAKAKEIADNINVHIQSCTGRAEIMDERRLVEDIQDASILINCTSLGMKATVDESIISSPGQLPKGIFVADIIYDPEKTKLLKIAEEAGVRGMNGLMMMVWQGALAFKIWTDCDMPVDLVKTTLTNR